jgi:hypothetical protein
MIHSFHVSNRIWGHGQAETLERYACGPYANWVNRLRTLTHQYPMAFAVALMLALLARGVVPSGWMPSLDRSAMITLCSDGQAVTAWVDEQGKLHKDDPHQSGKVNAPCAFAGVGTAINLLPIIAIQFSRALRAPHLQYAFFFVAVGLGLAAPPPPGTGPPALF